MKYSAFVVGRLAPAHRDKINVKDAGECWIRPGRGGEVGIIFHPRPPRGVSWCKYCERIVVRGKGQWWK